ncbi:MAG: sigma 54-interacting transcriptional regulator [Solibacillus sp.]
MKVQKQDWKRFIDTNRIDSKVLPQNVMISWENCKQLGVDPFRQKSVTVLTPEMLRERQQRNMFIITLVKQELAKYRSYFDIQLPLFILTDEDGYILWREGHEQTKHLANNMTFLEGYRWLEQDVGTNAIALALQRGDLTTVLGYEHYAVGSHEWACTAVVIRDKRDAICAVLDVSTYLNHSAIQLEVSLFLKLISANITEKLKSNYLKEQRKLIDYAYSGTQLGIYCDKNNQIIKCSDGLMVDEEEWVGQPIASLIAQKSLMTHQPEPLYFEQRLIGYFYAVVQKQRKAFVHFGVQTKNNRYQLFMGEVEKVAPSHLPVHIYGESGSGKELIAKTIHENSPFAKGSLVTINCGSISESLLESELFGFTPGAFTGANSKGYKGKIAEANGGTLFLDEVDSMSPRMQASLLRVLENQELTRIGSNKVESISFRLITASNRKLQQLVKNDAFRLDLFYRIYVCPLNVPPLRERKEDLMMLIKDYCAKQQWQPKWLAKVYEVAKQYEWQGNIREFSNFLARLHLYFAQQEPTEADIHYLIKVGTLNMENEEIVSNTSFEQQQLEEVLERHQYHLSKVAEELGVARSTLYRKMKKYNLK